MADPARQASDRQVVTAPPVRTCRHANGSRPVRAIRGDWLIPRRTARGMQGQERRRATRTRCGLPSSSPCARLRSPFASSARASERPCGRGRMERHRCDVLRVRGKSRRRDRLRRCRTRVGSRRSVRRVRHRLVRPQRIQRVSLRRSDGSLRRDLYRPRSSIGVGACRRIGRPLVGLPSVGRCRMLVAIADEAVAAAHARGNPFCIAYALYGYGRIHTQTDPAHALGALRAALDYAVRRRLPYFEAVIVATPPGSKRCSETSKKPYRCSRPPSIDSSAPAPMPRWLKRSRTSRSYSGDWSGRR